MNNEHLQNHRLAMTAKPALWGERNRAWESLSRNELLDMLMASRRDYLEKCEGHFFGPDQNPAAVELNRAHLTTLEMIRGEVLENLARVPDELFAVRAEGEKWSCHDLVNHLIVDEDGEFFPGPPDSLYHRIKTDVVHLRQLARFLRKFDLLPPADHFDT